MLCKYENAVKIVEQGQPLLVSGNAEMLSSLPRGNWIGGTTPYLMTEFGGIERNDMLLVSPMPAIAKLENIQRYGVGGLRYLPEDTPANGFSIVIIPSFSLVHQAYAKAIPSYTNVGNKAIAGWVSGTKKEGYDTRPKVFFGPIAHAIEDEIVAMHMSLPETHEPLLNVVNLYEPDNGDEISFLSEGFTVTNALVNGSSVAFAEYLQKTWIDRETPLVGEYRGIRLNIDIRSHDIKSGNVSFFAPVFKDVVYRFAKPVPQFPQHLKQAIQVDNSEKVFECICIKNYEKLAMGRIPIGKFEGPVSYGEIAHFLTNLSVVRLSITQKK